MNQYEWIRETHDMDHETKIILYKVKKNINVKKLKIYILLHWIIFKYLLKIIFLQEK
jgi:hypothetical protein